MSSLREWILHATIIKTFQKLETLPVMLGAIGGSPQLFFFDYSVVSRLGQNRSKPDLKIYHDIF